MSSVQAGAFKPRKCRDHERVDLEYTCRDGSCEDAVKGAHTHKQSAGPDGSGWLERKASGEIVYHTPWTRTPKKFSESVSARALKPRIETPANALIRMRKACARSGMEIPGHAGRRIGKGWRVASMNGHWALIEPGIGKEPHMDWMSTDKPGSEYIACKWSNPELWLAIQRAAVMSGASQAVRLVGDEGEVRVYLRDRVDYYDQGEFMEVVNMPGNRARWDIMLDWKYLDIALGCWPVTFKWKDDESMIELSTDAWKFLIMPMRDGVSADQIEARFKAMDTPDPGWEW